MWRRPSRARSCLMQPEADARSTPLKVRMIGFLAGPAVDSSFATRDLSLPVPCPCALECATVSLLFPMSHASHANQRNTYWFNKFS